MRTFGYGDSTFYGSFDILRHDTDDGELRLRQRIAGTATDVLSIVDGNSTFAGNIASGNIAVTSAGNGEVSITRTSGATVKSIAQSARGQIGTSSNHELQLITNATSRLTIDTSGNSTFAGDVTLNKLTTSTGLEYQVRNTNGASGNHVFKSHNTSILTLDGGTNNSTFAGSVTANTGSKITSSSTDTTFSIETTSGSTIFPILDFVSSHSSAGARIRVSGTDVISIDKSQNATFEGDVTLSDGNMQISAPANTDNYLKINVGNVPLQNGVLINYAGASQSTGLFINQPNGGGSGAIDYALLKVNNQGANPTFYSSNNVANPVIIKADGNVGIGTASPYTNLEVAGSGLDSIIRLYAASGTANIRTWEMRAVGVAGEGLLFRQVNDANNSYTNRMLIDTDGNVGIGTTSPSSKLTVSGVSPNLNDDENAIRIENHSSSAASPDELGNGIVFAQKYWSGSAQLARTGGIYGIKDASNGSYGGGLAFYTQPSGVTTDMVQRMRITSGGDVEITGGYSSAQSFQSTGSLRVSSNSTATNGNVALELMNDATGTRYLATFTNLNGVVGSISTYSSATSYNTSSDYRLKEDLQDFNGLEKVSKIPVYNFKWKIDDNRSYGVIAHELQEVLPQAVTGDKDAEEMQSVDYSKIVPLLVKSIQELKAEVDKLKQECKCKN